MDANQPGPSEILQKAPEIAGIAADPNNSEEPPQQPSEVEPPGNGVAHPLNQFKMTDQSQASIPKVIAHQRPKVGAKKN